MSAPSTLVIQHGDLSSLVLMLMQPDASKVIAWHPEDHTPAGRQRKHCAEQLAEARCVGRFFASESVYPGAEGRLSLGYHTGTEEEVPLTESALDSRMLLDAGVIARHFDCTRILSPLLLGPDHTRIARALERAMLIAELVEVERDTPRISIDLPLVERTDTELVELAMDLSAPPSGFWPCAHGGGFPCGACDHCRRWMAAFDDAGIAWPFEPTGVMG